MLKCSCCSTKLKDCVVAKCYHMFCRQCLDSRLESKSKNCPICKAKFSEEDIKPFWWK